MSTLGAMMLDGAARTATRRSPRTRRAPAHLSSVLVLNSVLFCGMYSLPLVVRFYYLAYSLRRKGAVGFIFLIKTTSHITDARGRARRPAARGAARALSLTVTHI